MKVCRSFFFFWLLRPLLKEIKVYLSIPEMLAMIFYWISRSICLQQTKQWKWSCNCNYISQSHFPNQTAPELHVTKASNYCVLNLIIIFWKWFHINAVVVSLVYGLALIEMYIDQQVVFWILALLNYICNQIVSIISQQLFYGII